MAKTEGWILTSRGESVRWSPLAVLPFGRGAGPYQLYAVYLLLALVFSGVWLELDHFGILTVSLLVGLMVLFAFGRGSHSLLPEPSFEVEPDIARPTLTLRSVLIGATICGPPLLYLALTWNEEFPFLGDHDFQLISAETFAGFWTRWLPFAGASTMTAWLAYRKGWLRVWIPIAVGLVVLTSMRTDPPARFANYPGLGYFLDVPLIDVAGLFEWKSPLDALRLTNALAVPLWLFGLRPWLIKKWPDPATLAFGAFYFFQQHVVYYFTTSYREPWGIVLTILACEYYLVRRGPRALGACLLLGLASLIKEPVFIVIPFLWLGCMPWRWGVRNFMWAAWTGLTSVLPFLCYLTFRRQAQVNRTFGLLGLPDILSAARFKQYAGRVLFDFRWTGLVMVGFVLLLAALWILSRRDAEGKMKAVAVTGCGAFFVVFFYIDKQSMWWTGYSRFFLLAFSAIGLVLLAWSPKILPYITGALIACNLVTLVPLFADTSKQDYARNFFEHVDSPIYLPIRSLFEEADSRGLLSPVRHLVMNNPIGFTVSSAARPAYPAISSRFPVDIRPPGEAVCVCQSRESAILMTYVYRRGLGLAFPAPANPARIACKTEMERSCSNVLTRSYDNEIIGLLGTGTK